MLSVWRADLLKLSNESKSQVQPLNIYLKTFFSIIENDVYLEETREKAASITLLLHM